jgi:hypothetical protein
VLYGQVLGYHLASDSIVTAHKNATFGIELISRDRVSQAIKWRRADFCDTDSAHLQVIVGQDAVYFGYSCAHNAQFDKYNITDGALVWRAFNNATIDLGYGYWVNSPLALSDGGDRLIAAISYYTGPDPGKVCSMSTDDGTFQWCQFYAQNDLLVTADGSNVYVAIVAAQELHKLDITAGIDDGSPVTVDANTRIASLIANGTDNALYVVAVPQDSELPSTVYRFDTTASLTLAWRTNSSPGQILLQGTAGSEAVNLAYDSNLNLLVLGGDVYSQTLGRYRAFAATLDATTGALQSVLSVLFPGDVDLIRIGVALDASRRTLFYSHERYDYTTNSFYYKVKDFCY